MVARAILYLVAAANVSESNDPQLALCAITLTVSCVLLLRAFIQIPVYRKPLVNILEIFFFLNILFFLYIFTGYSLSNPDISQATVASISVLSAFFIMLLIILYHLYTYTMIFSILKKIKSFRMAHTLFTRNDQDARRHLSLPPDDDIHRFNELLDIIDHPVNSDDYSVPLLRKKPMESFLTEVEVHQAYMSPLVPETEKPRHSQVLQRKLKSVLISMTIEAHFE